MRLFKIFLLFCAGALVLSAPLVAQEQATKSDEAKKAAKPLPEPKVFVTSHSGQFGNETVAYTATAGETYLRDEKGKPKAAIFTLPIPACKIGLHCAFAWGRPIPNFAMLSGPGNEFRKLPKNWN